METLLVGVDVGTGSARAGVLTPRGDLLGRAERPIAMRRLDADRAEHDSTEIWSAVCAAVRAALAAAGADPAAVAGIAFDATCSLVLRDREGAPLAVSADAEPRWDTFVWLDHRAMAEAAECTASGHRVLDFAGGVMSPEMEIPKLMWFKRNRPDAWARLGYGFDLVDFLSWMATGSLARSQSSLACKWNFLAHEERGWQDAFLAEVGLDDAVARCALPDRATPPGSDLGPLTDAAAAALGLTTSCRVGAGLIDAHAGALGMIGGLTDTTEALDRNLALVAGTSNSIIALAPDPRPARGIWGPYAGALFPGAWLSEGGQTAAGALLDHLVTSHASGGEPGPDIHARIVERIAELRAEEGEAFAARLHVLPDFHGNRSPLADPTALGAISGLTLHADFDALCRLYYRTAVAIALGLRQILETFGPLGYGTTTLHVTGGHTRNPLLMELYADATGCILVEAPVEDAVLLGTAMVAAAAAGIHPGLLNAARAMHRDGRRRHPDPDRQTSFQRDLRALSMMQRHRAELDALG